ncbi:hypothetical protein KSF78_0004716 [Schistosoma japonicum]|nr:hypothetical protein KSF78_0004716 [Schistosoma japonicum]
MEREKSFEVLEIDRATLSRDNNGLVESIDMISEQVVHDETSSYTELSESDYSENSPSTSTFDFVKLELDQNNVVVAQPSPSYDLDQLPYPNITEEKEPLVVYERSCIQFSRPSELNTSDRIHFYFHDFLLGGILFSLLLGRSLDINSHMFYSEQYHKNISFLSTEILQKDTAYRHLDIKHKHLKNVTQQLRLDMSILTGELRDKQIAYNELKADYKYVKDKMADLTKELRKLKFALMDLKHSSLFFPGIRLIKDILCRILSVCPDLDGV